MISFYVLVNRAIDVLMKPLAGLHPLAPLTIGAAILGVAAMLIYKYTSWQAGIKRAKDRIKGHFYEVWLYIDDATVIVRAQLRILRHAAVYLGLALPPLVIMVVVFFPLFANFETRYAMRPAMSDQDATASWTCAACHQDRKSEGEPVLVKLRLEKYFPDWQDKVKLELPEGVEMVGYPIRFTRGASAPGLTKKPSRPQLEVNYKLRATIPGEHALKFEVDGTRFEVPLVAGGAESYGQRVYPETTTRLGRTLLYPPRNTIPQKAGVERVELQYPKADFPAGGWNTWWVWPFLIISLLVAFAVKGIFKVEI